VGQQIAAAATQLASLSEDLEKLTGGLTKIDSKSGDPTAFSARLERTNQTYASESGPGVDEPQHARPAREPHDEHGHSEVKEVTVI